MPGQLVLDLLPPAGEPAQHRPGDPVDLRGAVRVEHPGQAERAAAGRAAPPGTGCRRSWPAGTAAARPAPTSARPTPGSCSPPARGCAAADPRPATCGAGTPPRRTRRRAAGPGRPCRGGPPRPPAPDTPAPGPPPRRAPAGPTRTAARRPTRTAATPTSARRTSGPAPAAGPDAAPTATTSRSPGPARPAPPAAAPGTPPRPDPAAPTPPPPTDPAPHPSPGSSPPPHWRPPAGSSLQPHQRVCRCSASTRQTIFLVGAWWVQILKNRAVEAGSRRQRDHGESASDLRRHRLPAHVARRPEVFETLF